MPFKDSLITVALVIRVKNDNWGDNMFKDKGYDEFLAESLKRADENVAAGRVFTLEESKAHIRQVIEHIQDLIYKNI